MIFLPSLFYTFLLTALIKHTSQQTTFCDPSNRPATCGYDYTPVCTFPTGCNDYTCTNTQRNACTACKDTTVAYYINGACPQDSIGTSDTDGSDAGSDAGAGTGETDGSDGSDAGTETGGSDDGNTTNSTTPDGTNSTNSTDIDTNSTTNSTNGSGSDPGSSTGNNTDPGTGVGNTTNSTNSTNNNSGSDPDASTTIPCADYGAMIRSSGKVVLGALCCGSEPKKCPKASTKVCGVLTNCIGDICRKTYKNYCTACHDNTTSVQLYLNAPCETLFPI